MKIITDERLLALINLVRAGLDQRGYHIYSFAELQGLWGEEILPDQERLKRVQHFARACGARVQTDGQMRMACFVRRPEREDWNPEPWLV